MIIASLIAGVPIALKAFQALRLKAFSIDLLVTIAVVGALIIGEYVESAVVSFLFLFGDYLEGRTLQRTRASLKSLIDMAPKEATVLRDGKRVVIPADEVELGDHVIVQPGGRIPVDGKVITGQSLINQAAITGESVPVNKKQGDQVFSSTISDNGYLEIQAEKVGDDTIFAKIIELVEDAQENAKVYGTICGVLHSGNYHSFDFGLGAYAKCSSGLDFPRDCLSGCACDFRAGFYSCGNWKWS